jgi:hypothetical protein
MAGANAVDLPAGDLPCTDDAGKAEPARSSTGRERPKKQLGDISNLLIAKVALVYASRLAGLHIPVRDVARDHDHDGRGALWGAHVPSETRPRCCTRSSHTCGQ